MRADKLADSQLALRLGMVVQIRFSMPALQYERITLLFLFILVTENQLPKSSGMSKAIRRPCGDRYRREDGQ